MIFEGVAFAVIIIAIVILVVLVLIMLCCYCHCNCCKKIWKCFYSCRCCYFHSPVAAGKLIMRAAERFKEAQLLLPNDDNEDDNEDDDEDLFRNALEEDGEELKKIGQQFIENKDTSGISNHVFKVLITPKSDLPCVVLGVLEDAHDCLDNALSLFSSESSSPGHNIKNKVENLAMAIKPSNKSYPIETCCERVVAGQELLRAGECFEEASAIIRKKSQPGELEECLSADGATLAKIGTAMIKNLNQIHKIH